jgi:E3 ubiquitin-protein ligase HERC2
MLALGRKTKDTEEISVQHPPDIVSYLSKVKIVRTICGENCSFFLTDTGKLYSCGSGETNQLGHGDGEDQLLPAIVSGFEDEKIVNVVVGNLNCAALSETGLVFTWGWTFGAQATTIDYFVSEGAKIR